MKDADALTADPDGDGFTNFQESVHGTNPHDPNSFPPGTPDESIIFPPPPEEPPDPDDPPAAAGADWHFEVVTSRKNLPKFGFDEFIASTPPKRYLQKTETVSFSLHGDSGEAPESPINGTRLTEFDPITGIRTVVDYQHPGNDNMGGSVVPKTSTLAVGVTEVSQYDDEPNTQGDRNATKTLTNLLQKENTTEMLVANVIARLPAYPSEYAEASPQAHRNLYDDELGFDCQKVKYRVVWNDGVAEEARHPVKWLLIFEPEDDPDTEENESETAVEVVKVVEWDGEGENSSDFEIDPESEKTGEDGRYFLLPVELAPEVLAVNSDFDEGRIDPSTGNAIPDCDDDDIALESVRNHLDGKFVVNERITDDMHTGFFGMNPSNLGDAFWDGANVTIRKVDKTDPATGHPESGHIRLYGKWGDGPSEYRAIIPYDFDTLATTNLAAGGINKVPAESVYGATSPFPEGTSYFIEGVHPGKITLEWRYQKGSVDVKFEQGFEVCTHKNALQWKQDLAYKIRLETSNDQSGEINTIAIMLPGESYKERMERASEYYDFYQDCFLSPMRSKPLHPQAMTWPGLARLAGSQVVGGLSDSEYARMLLDVGEIAGYTLPQPIQDDLLQWSLSETKDLQQALFTGARTIFQSIGWQMHAYRSSGYRALDWVETTTGEAEVSALSGVWKDMRMGILNHDKDLLDDVSLRITRREQNVTIVPTWTVISGLFGGTADWMFSVLGKNSCTPAGIDFSDLFPQFPLPAAGSLANTADRWLWIQPATAGGILDTWNKLPTAARDALVRSNLELDARRFSRVHQIAYQFPTYLYLPIWVWDNEDVP